jgi:hypothetical protein
VFHAPDVYFISFLLLYLRAQQQEAPTNTLELTMERLFSPCTRYRDQLESRGDLDLAERFRRHPELLQELNLDVSTEEFLSAERAYHVPRSG